MNINRNNHVKEKTYFDIILRNEIFTFMQKVIRFANFGNHENKTNLSDALSVNGKRFTAEPSHRKLFQ